MERQRGSRLSSCNDAGRRKEQIARGVKGGGFHTHEPLGGGRKDGTQGEVRGYKASRGGDITFAAGTTLAPRLQIEPHIRLTRIYLFPEQFPES